jgi:DNA repair exonuclease SbcCD ATPase subunit
MRTSPIHAGEGRSPRSAAQIVFTALWVFVVIAWPSAGIAQDNARPVGPDAITPVEEFSRQLDEFKKSIPELNKKIEDGAASIDRWTDVDKARKEIEELRALVGAALGAVSDNGVVSQLGTRALDHERDKLRTLEQDNRFKPEEKQFLIDQWRRLKDETERANDELATARREFVDLLRTLQSNEDFVDELIQIRQAQKALEVIRQLTQEIRGASDQLKKLISGIKPPGA